MYVYMYSNVSFFLQRFFTCAVIFPGFCIHPSVVLWNCPGSVGWCPWFGAPGGERLCHRRSRHLAVGGERSKEETGGEIFPAERSSF